MLNAQGLRITVVVVLGRNENICRAVVKALSHDETQFTTKIDGFFEFHLTLMLNAHTHTHTHIYIESQGFSIVFSLFYR